MPRSKKRKLSGLSGVELLQAYDSLRSLKKTIVYEGKETESEEASEEDPNDPAPEGFVEQIDTLLALLGSKLGGLHPFSSPHITATDLAKLNLVFTGILRLKPTWDKRVPTTTTLGKDQLWSSENLYRQLHLLETLVPRTAEATARAWIDAFLFRVSAMLPADKRMVLNMERAVPATNISSSRSTPSGYVDYTAFVGSKRVAGIFLERPQLNVLRTYMKNDTPSGFFVIEAKLLVNISEHVPRAVSEIYACGRFLQTKILRGALTDGRSWIFLLMKFNENFDGAVYKESKVIRFSPTDLPDDQIVISEPWPDVIAAILSHWIENSFTDLGSDDWFAQL